MTLSKSSITTGRVLDRLADYSDESLLTEVRRVAQLVGKTSLALDDFERHARCSYAVLKQRFGGMRAALKRAEVGGAPEFHRNVPEEELLRELARIWDLVLTHEERRPYKDDLKKYNARFSYGPYYDRWHSWIKACEAVLDWESSIKQVEQTTPPSDFDTKRRKPTRKRPIPLKIRYAILLRDGFTCQICGRNRSSTPGLEVHIDHIKSEADGGTLEPSNLRCLCFDCNIGKGSYSES